MGETRTVVSSVTTNSEDVAVLKKIDEVEVESLRQEMREWQGRRIAMAAVAPAFLVAVATSVAKPPDPAPHLSLVLTWAAALCVLAAVSFLTWYGARANAFGVSYLSHFHTGFRWETRLDTFRQQAPGATFGLNQLLGRYYFGLWSVVVFAILPRYFEDRHVLWAAWLILPAIVVLIPIVMLWWARSRVRMGDDKWGLVETPRQSTLGPRDYELLELKALRHEMRDWQGRRFVLLAGAFGLVSATLALAFKTPEASGSAYVASLLGLAGFCGLTRYAHSANAVCASYIETFHPDFMWEPRLSAEKRLPSLLKPLSTTLHRLLISCYGVLFVVVIISFVFHAHTHDTDLGPVAVFLVVPLVGLLTFPLREKEAAREAWRCVSMAEKIRQPGGYRSVLEQAKASPPEGRISWRARYYLACACGQQLLDPKGSERPTERERVTDLAYDALAEAVKDSETARMVRKLFRDRLDSGEDDWVAFKENAKFIALFSVYDLPGRC